MTLQDIIFGIVDYDGDRYLDILNYCILLAKWFIHTAKRSKEKVDVFNYLFMLKNKLEVIEMLYRIRDDVKGFNEKWSMLSENI